jgi:hypothetical protein
VVGCAWLGDVGRCTAKGNSASGTGPFRRGPTGEGTDAEGVGLRRVQTSAPVAVLGITSQGMAGSDPEA